VGSNPFQEPPERHFTSLNQLPARTRFAGQEPHGTNEVGGAVVQLVWNPPRDPTGTARSADQPTPWGAEAGSCWLALRAQQPTKLAQVDP
jgi:hypothetical protein